VGAAPPPLRAEALLFSMLRQESSMALFESAAAAAGLAPQDVTSEVLGPDCGAGSSEEGAVGGNDDDAAALLPFGAVRLCHLPAGALPRSRVRAHRLYAPKLPP
jgi:hypothetical protein